MSFFRKIMTALQTAQIYPATERIEPNDKATKMLFSRNAEQYEWMLNGKNRTFTEKKSNPDKGKKKADIVTSYSVKNVDGYDNKEPLNEFDRAVLSACISEFVVGNMFTTYNIIFRALIGRVGDNLAYPTDKQKAAIQNSVDKLMFTEYTSDAKDSLKKMKYENGDELTIEKSAVLPCFRVKAIINGQTINAIFFNCESPIFTVADFKNQVIHYETKLLDTPNKENDIHIITVKNYVMRRALEIVNHKNLTPSITFDDVFTKCNLTDASHKVKANVREIICLLLDNLKNAKIIKNYKGEKRGVSWYSISISR